MNKSSLFLSVAVAATVISVTVDTQAADKKDMQKCYGIVKAGKNDCATANGSHGCAALAKADGDMNEWILLPSGVCERLKGGSTEPKN